MSANINSFQLNFSKNNTLPWSRNSFNTLFNEYEAQENNDIAFGKQESENYFFAKPVKSAADHESELNSFMEDLCSPSKSQEVKANSKPLYNNIDDANETESYILSNENDEDCNEVIAANKRLSKINQSQQRIMKNWTEEDNKLLLKLGVQYKNDWKKINQKFE